MKTRRRLLALTTLGLAWAAMPFAAAAQASWPEHPIKMLVGFPPGGSTDQAARLVAARLTQSLGQSVVVENRAGASGNIAADVVAAAPPDGYTLLMAASSFAAAPAFTDKLSWDPVKSFTPIAQVATVPILAVTTPKLGVKNAEELVKLSKSKPGQLNLASPGPTTLVRLSGEQFKQIAGIDWVTVHYKGGAPAMQDMLAGTADVMFANISDVMAQVSAGKLQPIAVASTNRSAMAPDIPTFREAGYPDFVFTTWQAVVGPAGMPRAIVERLNAEIRKILAQPDIQAQFLKMGTEVSTGRPEDFAALLVQDVAKIKRLAKSVGATSTN
ncbi:MAG TPA: tripartite tricarboxylate transporter substrate-binding protein [Ramlibacter sp.]|uniref:Bug family tripartite tricarboxylate transporter substrate binding protein n=1 Tax=Ramlibacter sp. TaxID=1917967 RepID=UPI002C809521|nr:tripartite tricarboxylate transporter substrate-binding protein [Ramlibacter sp.]HVU81736.1 tripartite tricarboxylate transporter substrate-binding protein [Rhodanobacteraceae bacterium]HVZ45181.1 tripartite tricarboxylate transporter substrate-binding protein [Ramlibacter sp.]